MVGILVHGNNHFILSGPPPNDDDALAMSRHWSIIQIDAPPSSTFGAWQIRNKEWAVVVPDKRETSAPVAQLLAELAARGIRVRQCRLPCC
jgi:hypothetical protein